MRICIFISGLKGLIRRIDILLLLKTDAKKTTGSADSRLNTFVLVQAENERKHNNYNNEGLLNTCC